jgi:hypothetical protein
MAWTPPYLRKPAETAPEAAAGAQAAGDQAKAEDKKPKPRKSVFTRHRQMQRKDFSRGFRGFRASDGRS